MNFQMQNSVIQLSASALLQINPIERRANCKMTIFSGYSKHYIGGMTADAVSNQIYQFKLNHNYAPARIEWREIHFDNNLFSPRNSFAACGGKDVIYVWGGLEMLETADQKCLSDLIEINIEKGTMKLLPLKQNIKIHSSTLFYDNDTNHLIAYGGSDENSNLPTYIYRLNLAQATQYEWSKSNLQYGNHEGFVWQHSANLSKRSFFNGQEGKFLTVVGGCRFPHSPYKTVVEINLQTCKVTNQVLLDKGIVSHDSVERQGKLFIFGGAVGGDFNSIIYVVDKGTVKKLKGHPAIGCSCCLIEGKILVYGGVSGASSINGPALYE